MPWIHLQLSPTGKIYSCCETTYESSLGDVNKTSLDQIWLGEEFNNLRKKMIEGVFPPECERCQRFESLGFRSLRDTSNSFWPEPGFLPDQPVYLDLRFDNKCNFKCRSCNPTYSSAWISDLEKIAPGQKLKIETNKKMDESLNIIKKWLPKIQRIYFAGGEPLISQYHALVLEELISTGNRSVQLVYSTNFSTLPDQIINYWKQFNHVNVGASIDGVKEIGEFIRKGLNWSEIKKNREKLRSAAPHVVFRIDWTLSVYNVFHLPDALEHLLKDSFIKSIDDFNLNFLDQPEYFHPSILKKSEIQDLKIHYQKCCDKFRDFLPKDETYKIQAVLDKAINFVINHDKRSFRIDFRYHNRQLDKIRGEKSSAIFPELKNLIGSES